MKTIYVIKANGEREIFDERKVRQSLLKARVPQACQRIILNDLESGLYQNIPTTKINQLIEESLAKVCLGGRLRYRLKRAVMELGPTGYPFEKYIGFLLTKYGYQTEVEQLLNGSCVTHEVDVVAKKDRRVYFVECKFHNQVGMRSDLKVALYVEARGEDLLTKLQPANSGLVYGSWIFTNTKFSQDAIAYAECKTMRLTGWNYPQEGNLQSMIETKALYPLTVLTSLTAEQKNRLLEQEIILVKQLLESGQHLSKDVARECASIDAD